MSVHKLKYIIILNNLHANISSLFLYQTWQTNKTLGTLSLAINVFWFWFNCTVQLLTWEINWFDSIQLGFMYHNLLYVYLLGKWKNWYYSQHPIYSTFTVRSRKPVSLHKNHVFHSVLRYYCIDSSDVPLFCGFAMIYKYLFWFSSNIYLPVTSARWHLRLNRFLHLHLILCMSLSTQNIHHHSIMLLKLRNLHQKRV